MRLLCRRHLHAGDLPPAQVRIAECIHPFDLPPDIRLVFLQSDIEFFRPLFQFLLHLPVDPGLEDPAEDFAPLPGSRVQQLKEFPLGDHGDLGELSGIQPQDLFDLLIRLPLLPLKFLPVRQEKAHLRRLFHQTHGAVCIFPPAGAHIFGIAPHRVLALPAGKCVFHISLRAFVRILAAHHIAVAHPAAGPVIECVGDGVKDGRLPGARVAGNEKESAFYHCKIDNLHAGIGSERGHGKSDRSHCSSPFA